MTVLMVLVLCAGIDCVVEEHRVTLQACRLARAATAAELAHGREVRSVRCRWAWSREHVG